MTESLRILILEDNPADAELVQFELQEAGLAFTSKVVITEEDFVRGIQEFCPDLILSDYDLPKYNGALALAESRRRCPDTPFILVTGAVTEDRAIDILTQGAKDYVLKSRLQQRLGPAVRRAIAEAEEHRARKQAEAELREAHRTLEERVKIRTTELEKEIASRKKAETAAAVAHGQVQSIIDNTTAIIYAFDLEGRFVMANTVVAELLNSTPEKMIGKTRHEFMPKDDADWHEANDRQVIEAGRALEFEEYSQLKGRSITWLTTKFPLRDIQGRIYAVGGISTDITERKAAEKSLQESEARLQFALTAAQMVAWDYDPVNKKVNISRMANEVLALSPGQGLEDSDQGYSLIHPDDVEGHRTLVTEAIQNAGSYISVYRQVRAGEVFWLEERGQAITNEMGKTVRLVGVTQNVTTRKVAELGLERARNILTEAQKIAHLGSFEYVAATRTTVWSEEEYHIYGLDPTGPSPAYDIMLEKSIHPDDAALLHETFTKAMQSCTVYELEHRIVRPDGSVRWVYDRAHPYFDKQGNLLRYVGATLDITERKMADEALRASDEQFRVLIQNLQSAIALIDEQGVFRIVNNSFLRVFEIPQDATILNVNNRDWSQWQVFDEQGVLLEVDEHPVRKAALTRAAVKNQLVAVKSPSSPDLKWLLVSAEPILTKAGGIHRIVCTYYDITKRKQAEDTLRESELKFRSFVEASAQIVWMVNAAAEVDMAIPAWQAFTGQTEEEARGVGWMNAIHVEDRLRVAEAWRKAIETRGLYEVEYRLRIHDGTWREIQARGVPVKNADGTVKEYIGTCIDITERKRAEEELRRQRELLHVTLASIGDAVIATDNAGVVTFMNAVAEALTGWPLQEATTKPATEVFKIVNEHSRQTVESPVSKVLREGVVVGLANHTILIRKDGTEVPIDDSGAPIKDAEGKTLGVVLVFRDMTERRQAEDVLQTTMHRLATLISSMRGALLLVGEGRIELANQTFCDYFGLKESPSELIRLTPSEMLDKIKNAYHHPSEALGRIQEIVRQDQPVVGEELAMRGGRTCLRDFIPIHIDGKSYGRLWYHTDITARRRAEEATRERERLLQDVIDGSTSPIFLKNAEGKFITINATLERMLGMSREKIEGKTDYDIAPRELADYWRTHDKKVMETGKAIQIEEVADLPDGHHVFLANKFPLVDVDGQVYGVGAISHEITDRKHAEMELQERTQQLEDANKELESFSYSVSHDLRAPLRAIDGYAKMIFNKQGDKFDEDTRRKFDMIRNSAKTMGLLIDDLLTLSRLGKEALSLSRLNVEELTRNAWEGLKANDLDRSVNLKISHLPPGMGDWSLMKQVLVNILSNAVKFTRVRKVPLIEVGGYEEGSEVVYYVRDNGIGFDMQYHDNLFGVFKRLHSTAEYEGTGVGLAIVQRIINKHGGRVWAEGEVDKGATFYFSLPTCMQSGD